jgi:DNA-binding NarL/FixJ family response regulator
VLLVEDGQDMRHYLAHAISQHPELELLAACADLASARARLRHAVPDVLLTDLALPDGDGVALIRELKRATPACECMVITVFGTEARVVAAIEAGATGYLLKDEPIDRVAQAVLSLVRGGSPMSPGIARHVLNRLRGPVPVETAAASLSERELTVLHALSRGFTYGEVAEQLSLSDDGRGGAHETSGGLGMRNMRKRAAQLGGTLEVLSGSEGTSVTLTLPAGLGLHPPADPGAAPGAAGHRLPIEHESASTPDAGGLAPAVQPRP